MNPRIVCDGDYYINSTGILCYRSTNFNRILRVCGFEVLGNQIICKVS